MDMRELIALKIKQRDQVKASVDQARAGMQAIIDGAKADGRSGGLTSAEDERVEGFMARLSSAPAEIAALDAKIEEYRAIDEDDTVNAARRGSPNPGLPADDGDGKTSERKVGGAVVVREPRTYDFRKAKRGEQSFFGDVYMHTQLGDVAAQERLKRHGKEVQVEREPVGMSKRAQTTTTFAGLIVPQYLVDMVALIVRSGRPFANSVMHMELPDEGMSFVIPRGTTGAAVAAQATENTSVQNTDEVWANLTVNVNTIAGQQDVSRQSLERGTPGLDLLVYTDIAGAYHAELDRQAIYGPGTGNQMLGAWKTSGIFASTLYGAAPTYTLFNSKIAGQIAAIAGAGAGIDPKLIVMHPRRWGWMNTLVDTAGRPLIVPLANGAYNAGGVNLAPGAYGDEGTQAGGPVDLATYKVVGSMQGLEILTDANIPITVGTESEDIVGVYDPSKLILWEDGDGMPSQLRFEQTLGNQLTTKLVAYGYAAFTAGRYPVAVGTTGGLDTGGATFGLVAPTF